MSESSSIAFFDAWQTYQKVVAANHMFHREMATHLAQFLNGRFRAHPLSFLDLGCGDAATLAPLLVARPLKLYKGVDLSEPALARARKNLATLSCPVALLCGDILAALAHESSTYDVIYCSFSLHHLSADKKAAFFRQAAGCLRDRGALLLVDVMREEGESLAVYYRRYCGWARENFTTLNADELDRICDRIVNFDLPEPRSALTDLARAAGLSHTHQIASYSWHAALCFTTA